MDLLSSLTPVWDKKRISSPVFWTESRATQPAPDSVSSNAIVEGSSHPPYTRIEFLPKMISLLLCIPRACTSSCPLGHTVSQSREPAAVPASASDQLSPTRVSLQYTVSFAVLTPADHSLPNPEITMLPSGAAGAASAL